MDRQELNDFYNHGFGWICRRCERDLKKQEKNSDEKRSRLLREGEAEAKQPTFSNLALAQWADKANQILMCPRCGIVEPIDKS